MDKYKVDLYSGEIKLRDINTRKTFLENFNENIMSIFDGRFPDLEAVFDSLEEAKKYVEYNKNKLIVCLQNGNGLKYFDFKYFEINKVNWNEECEEYEEIDSCDIYLPDENTIVHVLGKDEEDDEEFEI